jgi:PRC-barrel domain
MAMQGSQSVATDETHSLIASDKVEGTAVYNRQGEKLGSIHTLMIDKISGKVAYAAVERADLRYRERRLHRRSRPEHPGRRADLCQRRDPGLGRPQVGRAVARALPRATLLGVDEPIRRPVGRGVARLLGRFERADSASLLLRMRPQRTTRSRA